MRGGGGEIEGAAKGRFAISDEFPHIKSLPRPGLPAQGMKHSAVDLDGGVMLIFDMYNVLSAGGYLAKKIGRASFQTLRV